MWKKHSLFLILIITAPLLSALQLPHQPGINAPQIGDVLQGKVIIRGTTEINGFQSSEISYAYDREGTVSWFLLNQMSETVSDGPLAAWDTSTITDGIFKLRLRIMLQDGTVKEYIVNGLKVRNYTVVETTTPPPKTKPLPVTPAHSANLSQNPTSTALPPNPASITSGDLFSSLLEGGLFVLILFLGWGLYLYLRRTLHR